MNKEEMCESIRRTMKQFNDGYGIDWSDVETVFDYLILLHPDEFMLRTEEEAK